jgi:general secretion pathway protein H
MPTSAPGSSHRRSGAGFSLLELLVVVSIIAIASAGVAFAVRDAGGAALEKDAQRLAALLESARAKSRMSGQPVRWVATADAFRFEGLVTEGMPDRWLAADTRVAGTAVLFLGPEPVIGAQAVVLTGGDLSRNLRVATDGLRPFTVSAE